MDGDTPMRDDKEIAKQHEADLQIETAEPVPPNWPPASGWVVPGVEHPLSVPTSNYSGDWARFRAAGGTRPRDDASVLDWFRTAGRIADQQDRP